MKKLIKNKINETMIKDVINNAEYSDNILEPKNICESKIDEIFGEIFVEKDISKTKLIFNKKKNEYKEDFFKYIKSQKENE